MCLLSKAEKKNKKNLTDRAEYSAYPQHAERRLENSSCATSCSKSDGRAEISPTRGLKSRRPPRCPTARICESMQCGRLKASYSNSWVGIMAWAWQIKTILKGRGGRRTLNGMTHGRAGGSFLFSLSLPPPQTWGACLLFGLLQKYFHSAEFLLFLSPLPHPPFPLAQTHRCTFFFCFFLNVFFWWTFLTVWMCFSLFEMGCFVSVSIWDLPFILWHSWYFWSHHVFFFFFFFKGALCNISSFTVLVARVLYSWTVCPSYFEVCKYKCKHPALKYTENSRKRMFLISRALLLFIGP